MPRYKVDMKGVQKVKNKLGTDGAERIRRQVGVDVKEGVYTMAEGASDLAPVDTGALRNSIVPTVEQVAPLSWIFGSPLPYAAVQEYTNPNGDEAFFRRSIWAEQPELRDKIKSTVKNKLN